MPGDSQTIPCTDLTGSFLIPVMHKPDGQEFITRRDTIFTENTYKYLQEVSAREQPRYK